MDTSTLRQTWNVFAALACLGGCVAAPPADLAEDDLVDPDTANDTGYYSSLATELSGQLTGTIRVEPSAGVDLNDVFTQHSAVRNRLEFGMFQLRGTPNELPMNLNLTGAPVQITGTRPDGDALLIDFLATSEMVVKNSDLQAYGANSIDELLARERTFWVPRSAGVETDLFANYGDRCASGFDEGNLGSHNYFYYFDVAKCREVMELAELRVRTVSLAPPGNVFPEYDRLTDDHVITTVAFFGAADHDEMVSDWDWGTRQWRSFTSSLKARDFEAAGPVDSETGKGIRYARLKNGIHEIVDVIGPQDLHDLTNDPTNLFGRMVRTHEIVMYLGHSFYGQLSVLDDPSIYAPDTYQIFFMGSCWSYNYYTSQIFKNKATAADPTGWANADIVNDTEMGWFHNMADMAKTVLMNVLAGAESGGQDDRGRVYSWNNVINQMNRQAVQSMEDNQSSSHEIFGASGVRTNNFTPAN